MDLIFALAVVVLMIWGSCLIVYMAVLAYVILLEGIKRVFEWYNNLEGFPK